MATLAESNSHENALDMATLAIFNCRAQVKPLPFFFDLQFRVVSQYQLAKFSILFKLLYMLPLEAYAIALALLAHVNEVATFSS